MLGNRPKFHLRDTGTRVRSFYQRNKGRIKKGIVIGTIGAATVAGVLGKVGEHHREKAKQRIESYEKNNVRQPAEWVQLEFAKWWHIGQPRWQKKVGMLPPKTKNFIIEMGKSAVDKRNSEELTLDELRRVTETIYMNVSEDQERTKFRTEALENRLDQARPGADEKRIQAILFVTQTFNNYMLNAKGPERVAIKEFLKPTK